MEAITEPIGECAAINEAFAEKYPLHIWGLNRSARSAVSQVLRVHEKNNFMLIVTYDDARAEKLYEDYRFYNRDTYLYPPKDVLFYYADVHGNATAAKRLEIVKRIVKNESTVIITTIDGLMDRLPGLKYFESHTFKMKVGDSVNIDDLKSQLMMVGYENTVLVESTGQFSVRGGIIDIFPLTEECPVRIELFGDEIDSIREFDAESQRSIDELSEVDIFPASEFVLSQERIARGLAEISSEAEIQENALKKSFHTEQYSRLKKTVDQIKTEIGEFNSTSGLDSLVTYFYSTTVSFLDYIPKGTSIFIDEPERVRVRAENYFNEFTLSMQGRLEGGYILPGQAEILYSDAVTIERLAKMKPVLYSEFYKKQTVFSEKHSLEFKTRGIGSYQGNFERLMDDIKEWRKKDYRIVIVSPSETRGRRLAKNIFDDCVPAFFSVSRTRVLEPTEVMVTTGSLAEGCEFIAAGLVVLAESEIINRKETKKKYKRFEGGEALSSLDDLSIGDYVVHEHHGIGIYRGITQEKTQGRTKDFINIEYADGGKLYVPVEDMNRIGKFSEKDGRKPKLNKLGGTAWGKTTSRVRDVVESVAEELVNLYAIRQNNRGYSFSKDTEWQREFEEMFPYDETPDQIHAIRDTKKDMESDKIMDRLICGDVGFGKTEIALRAAFKCVQDGQQAAYLVPTTILAEQHYNTFTERMKDFPVRVRVLTRFCTTKEIKETIADLKSGKVDIVIGTHRLLSKDVSFFKLGLLIIDEEQRFGVKAKETIKELKKTVDVLTLTATPIPRTLHMSLVGIRDMSLLEEPPVDRRPIQTYVMEYDREIVKEAINRELARKGQVYYVYNRVEDIADVAAGLREMLPEIRIQYAHGKMNARELENIMHEFIKHEIDVLVSTTIIETGLDISNVNTIIIQNADKFGLAQLYQLRGRVGRSDRNAYAFLMYQKGKILKDVAEKRLSAIREFTDLGSGYKISLKDLEIRGAGNVLGNVQSGHMEDVGYDLYVKMLNHAIRTLKGEKIEVDFDTRLEIPVDAFVPDTYVKNEGLKLDLYKKIARITSEEDAESVIEEARDRFGNPPKEMERLIRTALLRNKAHSAKITEICYHQDTNMTDFFILNGTAVHVEKIPVFLKKFNHRHEAVRARLLTGLKSGFSVKVSGSAQQNQMMQDIEDTVELISEMIIVHPEMKDK